MAKDEPERTNREWSVLVLLGASGTGKTTAAAHIGRARGISWLQVDDLRQALQFSRANLPELNDELYYFLDNPDFALQPAEEVCRAFIGAARAMAAAVRIAIETHVATDAPVVIEGDGILPALVVDPDIAPLVASGAVRFCCVAAGGHCELLDNLLARNRGMQKEDLERAARQADANWMFNQWLVGAIRSLGIPVVASRPFATLPARIEEAISAPPAPEPPRAASHP